MITPPLRCIAATTRSHLYLFWTRRNSSICNSQPTAPSGWTRYGHLLCARNNAHQSAAAHAYMLLAENASHRPTHRVSDGSQYDAINTINDLTRLQPLCSSTSSQATCLNGHVTRIHSDQIFVFQEWIPSARPTAARPLMLAIAQ